MEMGERIKRLRLERGMTLEEVGEKVGVGKSTVRKWENGLIANMKRDKIAKIANALGCSPSYLMGWSEEDNMTDTNAEVIADMLLNPLFGKMNKKAPETLSYIIELYERNPELFSYIKKIDNMSAEKQTRIYGYIDALLD